MEMLNRGVDLMSGWSAPALGGQAQSAYTNGDVDLQDTVLGHTVSVRNLNERGQLHPLYSESRGVFDRVGQWY